MQSNFGQGLGYYQLLANYMPSRKTKPPLNQPVRNQGPVLFGAGIRPSEDFWTLP